ncbi:TRIC cation channel family protein [Mycoplasma sp. U97]|uniref:TRIC cation channel family protein n=2 Tax=Mycoplasma tauri TaxID=547987 RepID=A0A953NDI1_9MOLU|nr:TRIC cation channel family protein [Mycoplasma tauri]MBZ4212699.1 TRIC cation channel family protein [Mycoplasma tauri]MBZ4218033.1 TRIC cation channel family protein [Mycoplasma tauri]
MAFSASGASVAISKKMDLFGVCTLGAATAVGGGIIRDIVLDKFPPAAFINPIYLVVAFIVSLFVFFFSGSKISSLAKKIYSLVDAVGLAVFSIVGAINAIESNNLFLIVFVGVITGVGGGMLRDIFAGRIPIIFQSDVYATASLTGVLIFASLYRLNGYVAAGVGSSIILVIRILAIRFNLSLPRKK